MYFVQYMQMKFFSLSLKFYTRFRIYLAPGEFSLLKIQVSSI